LCFDNVEKQLKIKLEVRHVMHFSLEEVSKGGSHVLFSNFNTLVNQFVGSGFTGSGSIARGSHQWRLNVLHPIMAICSNFHNH
jgi:hypothetical protein